MSTSYLKQHVLYTDYDFVCKICEPLRKINIQGVIFMRHFRDGRFIDLSNQLEWSDYFLTRYLSHEYPAAMISDHMFIANGISLWLLNKDNVIWQEGETNFDFGNGISIAVNKEKYTDTFCFYTKKDQYGMNIFYINNMGLLKKFADFFLEKMQPVIKKGVYNPLYTPRIYLNHSAYHQNSKNTSLISEFLTIIDPAYQQALKCSQITQRQMECIKLCAEGKTAKEVAARLYLSTRTVESHLKNAKFRLGCSNLRQLISAIGKHFNF